MSAPPLPITEFAELATLIRAHHPLIEIQAREAPRVQVLLRYLCAQLDVPYFEWRLGQGLRREGQESPVYGTEHLAKALAHVRSSDLVGLYHFNLAGEGLSDARLVPVLEDLNVRLAKHAGAAVFSFAGEFPPALTHSVARITLSSPTQKEYYEYLNGILADIRTRQNVAMRLSREQLLQLLSHLRGLTLMEVRRLVTAAVVRNGALDEKTIATVIDAKGKSISQSAALEYYPADTHFDQIVGLRHLKAWLEKRSALFRSPEKAADFGLSPPKGLLLLGVQGCGKSASAKAVATKWQLPILRLDAGRLFDKYVGATEKNLSEALDTAQRLEPVVLWIDEIEKALAGGGDNDGGTSTRVLGTFLTWLQENRGVFVVATANDISKLPPELLRKGRFDEIFFVDLPRQEVRAQILEVHLKARDRNPQDFDLAALAAVSEGFSGGELEQAVVSALFTAFHKEQPLTTLLLEQELASTRPLSVTMAEKIAALREWAAERTVPAD